MNTNTQSLQEAQKIATQKASAACPSSRKGRKTSKELDQAPPPINVLMGPCHCIPLASYTDYELPEDFINQE